MKRCQYGYFFQSKVNKLAYYLTAVLRTPSCKGQFKQLKVPNTERHLCIQHILLSHFPSNKLLLDIYQNDTLRDSFSGPSQQTSTPTKKIYSSVAKLFPCTCIHSNGLQYQAVCIGPNAIQQVPNSHKPIQKHMYTCKNS